MIKLMLIVTLAISGCAINPVKPVEPVKIVKRAEFTPVPEIEPLAVREVNWQLMNRERIKNIAMDGKTDAILLYTLDEQNMAKLLSNLQELKIYIGSQQAQIRYLNGVLSENK